MTPEPEHPVQDGRITARTLAASLPGGLSFLLVVLVCSSVASMLGDFGVSWQHHETKHWEPQIAAWGFPDSPKALLHALDWHIFEWSPRVTRPLSNLFQLFDTPARMLLLRHILVPPSFSFTWIFTLVLSPWLLFLLLRRWNVEAPVALLAVVLYICNPGTLSGEVMLYRPGKALQNFFILFCLWLAARQDDARRQGASHDMLNLRFALLCLTAYIGFFFDEIILIVYPGLFLFFPRLIARSLTSILLFALLPVAYIFTVKWMMPYLSTLAGFPISQTYAPQAMADEMVSFSLPLITYLASIVSAISNAFIIVTESMGIIYPFDAHNLVYICMFTVTVILAYEFMTITARHRHERLGSPGKLFADPADAGILAWRAIVVLLGAFLYEGLLMSVSVTNLSNDVIVRPTPLFQYGVFCALFLIITLTLLVQAVKPPFWIVFLFTCCVAGANLLSFPATNQLMKDYDYYDAGRTKLALFVGRFSRLYKTHYNAQLLESKSLELWRSRISHKPVQDIPLELSYLLYERGFTTTTIPCMFGSFDTSWEGNEVHITCQP